MTEYLHNNNEKVELSPYLSYNRDDFFLFPRIKKQLKGKFFDKVENLARAVAETIPKSDYEESFQSWQNRLQCCMEINGEYVEGIK